MGKRETFSTKLVKRDDSRTHMKLGIEEGNRTRGGWGQEPMRKVKLYKINKPNKHTQ